MAEANDKTAALQRLMLPLDKLVPNPANPNKMRAREFDLLVENIQKMGFTEPVLVRPIEDGKYRIVGGHHRWAAAAHLDMDEIPCTVITDPSFDEETEAFQLVRMNVIHGQIDPEAFVNLYYKYAGKYSDEVLQESFGFADEAEFKKLIVATAKQLPKELQNQFKEAAKELKTIDGLAKLLNQMFTMYGDTLPHGYMIIEYLGQRSVWVHVSSSTMSAIDVLGATCIEKKRTLDDLLGGIVKLIASGKLSKELEQIIASTPEVQSPQGLVGLPTKDKIATVSELSKP